MICEHYLDIYVNLLYVFIMIALIVSTFPVFSNFAFPSFCIPIPFSLSFFVFKFPFYSFSIPIPSYFILPTNIPGPVMPRHALIGPTLGHHRQLVVPNLSKKRKKC